jgi:hypothetical protein
MLFGQPAISSAQAFQSLAMIKTPRWNNAAVFGVTKAIPPNRDTA